MISPGHKKDKKLDKEQVSGSLKDSVNRVRLFVVLAIKDYSPVPE